jgi:hypothetical protein
MLEGCDKRPGSRRLSKPGFVVPVRRITPPTRVYTVAFAFYCTFSVSPALALAPTVVQS